MKALLEFKLPLSGLGLGMHEYDFEIKNEFFSNFEASTIDKADLKMKVYLDKRTSFIEITFDYSGEIETDCDRCLKKFMLPIENSNTLLLKYSAEEVKENDDVDIIFISKGENEFDLSKFIYEFVLLSIPMAKNHEMAGEQCDEKFTQFFHREEEIEKPSNSVWDALKKFNKN